METKGSLPRSQEPTNSEALCNISLEAVFEALSAPHPTHKLVDHPLLAVCNCLFNRYATTLHI